MDSAVILSKGRLLNRKDDIRSQLLSWQLEKTAVWDNGVALRMKRGDPLQAAASPKRLGLAAKPYLSYPIRRNLIILEILKQSTVVTSIAYYGRRRSKSKS